MMYKEILCSILASVVIGFIIKFGEALVTG